MLLYDNLDDAKNKLLGTYVYYEDHVATVHDVKKLKKSFTIQINVYGEDKYRWIELEDPKLNYTQYNIGYANYTKDAVWWCRIPMKQYQQGLKSGQLKWVSSSPPQDFHPSLPFSDTTINMLQNFYPSFTSVKERLLSRYARCAAFHKDFALRWDPVHGDFIVDYKGMSVGHLKSREDFKLMEEFSYLREALTEVMKDAA